MIVSYNLLSLIHHSVCNTAHDSICSFIFMMTCIPHDIVMDKPAFLIILQYRFNTYLLSYINLYFNYLSFSLADGQLFINYVCMMYNLKTKSFYCFLFKFTNIINLFFHLHFCFQWCIWKADICSFLQYYTSTCNCIINFVCIILLDKCSA